MKSTSLVTILIVDDDADMRTLMVREFQRKGFRVLEAENGRNALNIVRSEKVDIVISDICMPGGDGVELLHAIREIDAHAPVVVLITGFSKFSEDDAIEQGARTVLAKPFERARLHAIVNTILAEQL